MCKDVKMFILQTYANEEKRSQDMCRGNYVNFSVKYLYGVGVVCGHKLCRKITNNGRAKETFAPLWRPRSETCNALVNAITLEALA